MNAIKPKFVMTNPASDSSDRVSRSQFLRLSGWFTLVLCLIAAILPLLFGQPGVWAALEMEILFSWQTALSGLLGLSIGAVVGLLITRWRPLQVIANHIARLVAWETFRTWDFVIIALMAAWGEELLFRGALQPLIGLVPMALMFGLLHATSVAHIVLAGFLGLWLGLLFEWSGNLWPPIVAHLTLDMATGLIVARKLRTGTQSI
jgi:membrane protease YdiL (CAAX protease family)